MEKDPVSAQPSEKANPVEPARDEDIARFIEQARWLLEYHERRSDSLQTRAVALLGFAGVILALTIQARLPSGVQATDIVRISLALTIAGVVVAAGFCVLVLTTKRLKAPGIGQLRQNWHDYARPPFNRGAVTAGVAESLLLAQHLDQTSPVDASIRAADARAQAFKWAVVSLAVALVGLTTLLIGVGSQL